MDHNTTLYELNTRIRDSIEESFPDNFWVMAEISELKINKSGHCYLELIEKDNRKDQIIAKARATIWSYTFRMLKPYFETSSGITFDQGIKILVKVKVNFHQQYSYSLNILDIDPDYTLGDLERKKQDTLKKLEQDGVIDLNKQIPLPIPPQRIALISSETAAGYKDFVYQLLKNSFDYKYYLRLFPSIMQGDGSIPSIINSLEKIFHYENFFDIVVIIRGGGSRSDLNCFDSYNLAYHMSQFPLPILTGIGHEQDISVADIVANTRLKTPTAVAEFILENTASFDHYIEELKSGTINMANEILHNKKDHLVILNHKFMNLTKYLLSVNRKTLDRLYFEFEKRVTGLIQLKKDFFSKSQSALKLFSGKYISEKKHFLDIALKTINYINPQNILKRGYSITYHKGNLVKKSTVLNKGDLIKTKFDKGEINSKVESVKKKGDK